MGIFFIESKSEGFELFEVDDSLLSFEFERMVVFVLEGGGVFTQIDDQENAKVGEEVCFGSQADKNDVKLILRFHLLLLISFSLTPTDSQLPHLHPLLTPTLTISALRHILSITS